jgi:hypothetical protein
MSIQSFTDKDLDNLIASIEESLDKAEVLTKSKALKKDDGEDEAMEDAPPAAEAAPDAQMGMSSEGAPADAGEQPEEAAAPEQGMGEGEGMGEGDEALQDEGQDAPLSDEELVQIYGSMQPEELERHFMVIQEVLKHHAGEAEDQQQPEQPEQPEQAAQPPQMPAEGEDQEQMAMKSSNDKEFAALKKTIEEQSKSIELLGKAFEALTKPQRKAVTDIEYIKKSEAEETSKSNLSKDEIRDLYTKINPGTLSKSERSMVNNYFLNGENKSEVEHIIQSKGGKI